MTGLILQRLDTADVRRMDVQNGLLDAALVTDCKDDQQLFTVMRELKGKTPVASINFVDQSNSLGG